MKLLFIVVAVFEGLTGIVLLFAPGAASAKLLGTAIEGNAAFVVARVLGAALISIAIICARAATGERGSTSLGIVAGLLFYNAVVGAVLVYAGVQLRMQSALLWPTIVTHNLLAVSSLVVLLRSTRRDGIEEKRAS